MKVQIPEMRSLLFLFCLHVQVMMGEIYIPTIFSESGISQVEKISEATTHTARTIALQPSSTESTTHMECEIMPDHFPRPREENIHSSLTWLQLCQVALGGPLDGRQLLCPEDPSCIKCIPEFKMRRAEQMMHAHLNKTLRDARRSFLGSKFPQPLPQKVVVVIATDSRGMKLVGNWLCGAQNHLGLTDLEQHTLLVPTDDDAFLLASATGLPTLHPRTFDYAAAAVRDDSSEKPLGAFNGAMGALWVVTNDLLTLGYNVITMDADIVWLKDPRPYVLDKYPHADVVSEMAPQLGTRGPANTGFVLWRPHPKTRSFAASLVPMVSVLYWRGCDQLAFNSLLRHWRFREMHYSSMCRLKFLDLHPENAHWISEDTVLLHGVGTNKENKFRSVGHWYFNSTCKHYSIIDEIK